MRNTRKYRKIIKLLPPDFKDGMENWSGKIEQHIADTNYGLLVWDLITSKILLSFYRSRWRQAY
ncbi:MAG: hypothetical protein CM15mP91_2070 [Chloroflexota bacterium]|nr:MAG: hypothetical protein CM15mP91_2070 [Chloroflexota bacterium]